MIWRGQPLCGYPLFFICIDTDYIILKVTHYAIAFCMSTCYDINNVIYKIIYNDEDIKW